MDMHIDSVDWGGRFYIEHSNWAAPTSAAVDIGVSLEDVLEAEDWSSAQTFQKHYHNRAEKAWLAHKVLEAVKTYI